MNLLAIPTLTLLGSYLLGAIPFGYLVARSKSVDILRQGSGNIGATNVGRVLGRKYGILVFVLDFAKGALPAAIATWVERSADWISQSSFPPDSLRVAASLAAFLGHLFPIYLRFRGGKGVSTGAGAVAVLLPLPFLVGFLAWLVLLCVTRYMSLASMVAAIALTGVRLAMAYPVTRDNGILTAFCLLATILVIVRHRSNLRRLFQGTENRLQETPAMLHFTKTLHVLALGLWFGTTIFFTITGLLISRAYEEVSLQSGGERPLWFPLPAAYNQARPSDKFPEPLRKEQGSRAFGEAVAPLFPWYFGIQAVCGMIAAATALTFVRASGIVHRIRAAVLLAGLATVGVGIWLERVVDEMRGPRNNLTDAVLTGSTPSADEVSKANAARADFAQWHVYSLLVNLATVLLVTLAMALAGVLPSRAEITVTLDKHDAALTLPPSHAFTPSRTG
jgi:acyl-phosphate glycerol 3-phosphate acyltransferase